MKLQVNEQGTVVLSEFYSGIILKTVEGNTLSIAPRDDTFEFHVAPKDGRGGRRFRVNMDDLTVGADDSDGQ